MSVPTPVPPASPFCPAPLPVGEPIGADAAPPAPVVVAVPVVAPDAPVETKEAAHNAAGGPADCGPKSAPKLAMASVARIIRDALDQRNAADAAAVRGTWPFSQAELQRRLKARTDTIQRQGMALTPAETRFFVRVNMATLPKLPTGAHMSHLGQAAQSARLLQSVRPLSHADLDLFFPRGVVAAIGRTQLTAVGVPLSAIQAGIDAERDTDRARVAFVEARLRCAPPLRKRRETNEHRVWAFDLARDMAALPGLRTQQPHAARFLRDLKACADQEGGWLDCAEGFVRRTLRRRLAIGNFTDPSMPPVRVAQVEERRSRAALINVVAFMVHNREAIHKIVGDRASGVVDVPMPPITGAACDFLRAMLRPILQWDMFVRAKNVLDRSMLEIEAVRDAINAASEAMAFDIGDAMVLLSDIANALSGDRRLCSREARRVLANKLETAFRVETYGPRAVPHTVRVFIRKVLLNPRGVAHGRYELESERDQFEYFGAISRLRDRLGRRIGIIQPASCGFGELRVPCPAAGYYGPAAATMLD